MVDRAQIFAFSQTAQSVISDYFTLPRGKVSFAGVDFPVYQADSRPALKLTRVDFAEAGKRCGARYRRHLEERGADDRSEHFTIVRDEINAMGGAVE